MGLVPALLSLALLNVASGQAPQHTDARAVATGGDPADGERDRVKSLPGAELDFALYAGYVSVDDAAGRELFYALAESTSGDASRDPLVLWLNGGPGCSSLGNGFMSELGPFYPTASGERLVRNEFAWNRVANMLFLESPAFVGWSYSNRSEDATVGDERTAADSYVFLRRWLRRFPRYASRPLWLAGESYAGHYLPNLARAIVHGNAGPAAEDGGERLNFQGFLVGNPLTALEVDTPWRMLFWYTHGIISDPAYDGAVRYCNYMAAVPPAAEPDVTATNASAIIEDVDVRRQLAQVTPAPNDMSKQSNAEQCDMFVGQAVAEFSGINMYDIYVDVCNPTAAAQVRQLALMLPDHPVGIALRPAIQQQPEYDPCIDNEVERFFNRPDVQRALHANTTGALPGPWKACTESLAYSQRDVLSSMLPVYEELLKSGIKMLVYSGDVDAIVPILGTRRWIASLGLEVAEPWRAWRSATKQVAGWTEAYSNNLTFASVRGAGHMVPYTQPERAFYLFSRWVHGQTL